MTDPDVKAQAGIVPASVDHTIEYGENRIGTSGKVDTCMQDDAVDDRMQPVAIGRCQPQAAQGKAAQECQPEDFSAHGFAERYGTALAGFLHPARVFPAMWSMPGPG